MAQYEGMVTAGLTGTSCVGKSSVLRGVEACLKEQCVSVREAARDFFEADPNHLGAIYDPSMGDRFSYGVQGRIQIKHLNRMAVARSYAERILEGRVSLYRDITKIAVIDDRTPFDAAVCVAAGGDKRGAERLFNRACDWVGLEPYDHLYLVDPAGVPYVQDKVRTESPGTRQRIHEAFLSFFVEHNIRYTLLSGTEQERVERVVVDIADSWAGTLQQPLAQVSSFSSVSGPLEAVVWVAH